MYLKLFIDTTNQRYKFFCANFYITRVVQYIYCWYYSEDKEDKLKMNMPMFTQKDMTTDSQILT